MYNGGLGMLKINKKSVLLILITSLFYNLSSIIISFLIMNIVDMITENNFAGFHAQIIYTIIFTMIQIILYILYNWVRGKTTKEYMLKLRKNMLSGIFRYSLSKFHKIERDEYISFFYNDLEYIKDKYIYRIYDIIENAAMLVMATIGIIIIYPYYLFAIIIIIFCALFVPVIFAKKASKLMDDISLSNEKLISWLQNILDGFDIIKSYEIEDRILRDGEARISNYENSEYKIDLFMNFVQVGLNFLLTLLTLVTYVIGGYLVIKGHITIGALIALAQLLFKVASPVMTISTAVNDINSTKSIQEKLQDICSYKPEKKQNIIQADLENPMIQMKNVSFSYDNESNPIINNISYSFNKNMKYAIVGENGSGKSTLLKLLAGWIEDYTGSILLNGIEIKNVSDKSIFENISYISQKNFVFNESICDNIFFGNEDEQKKKKAYELMNDLKFLTVLEKHTEGMDYVISENNNLSGGEIQKLSIIRALLKNSKILLIDEGDSNLDKESRDKFYEILSKQSYELIILITHNIDPEKRESFDEIIHMENGKLKIEK